MGLPSSVTLREVGPREGFQTLKAIVPTSDKLALIDALGRTGVKHIEVASFVRPDRVPQMADAEEIVSKLERVGGVSYTALYLNPAGFKRAEVSGKLDNQGWLYTAGSATFLEKNYNLTFEGLVRDIPDWIAAFREGGKHVHGLMVSTAFGCNYEGELSHASIVAVIVDACRAVENCGERVREVCLADTMGWATPLKLKRLVERVRASLNHGPDITLHLHDTRGSAMANVLAGLEEGIEIFDSSVGGMGGCPFAKGAAGNVATEDVAFMCEEMGIATGIDLALYVDAASLAERIIGAPLPGKLYKAWRYNSARASEPAG